MGNVDFDSLRDKTIERGFEEFHEGNYHDAEEIFAQFPTVASARIGKSMVLYNAGKPTEALAAIEGMDSQEAWGARCTLYKALEDKDNELKALKNLYDMSEGTNWLVYAKALIERDMFVEAEPVLLAAKNEQSHVMLADCYVHQSKLPEARMLLKAVLIQNKNAVPALMELCSIASERDDLQPNTISEIERVLSADATNINNKSPLLNMLAKACELFGDTAKAAKHYNEFFEVESADVDHSLFERRLGVDHIAETYTQELIDRVPDAEDHCPMIFILGMPRSGSTLIEQTLVAHSQIDTVGETTGISEMIADIQKGGAVVNSPDEAWVYYKDKFNLSDTEGYLIDKMPGNFHFIGLIYQLFPNAKFIYSCRDPLDNCVGCMTTHFRQGHPYSKIPEQTALEYINHLELVEFWSGLLPEGTIHTVRYEDNVADHAGETAKLMRFLGLDNEAACEKFYDVKRDVKTASLAQVVKPIYSTSIGRGDCLVDADVEGGAFRKLKEALDGVS